MTERLPRVTANEVIRVLQNIGFFFARQSGSHKIFKNDQGRRVTIPFHSGETLHPKLLQSILKDADITIEKFKELLK
jgi:predicted RNA binding protein YcfA (HicA-like mRNA interferase family)